MTEQTGQDSSLDSAIEQSPSRLTLADLLVAYLGQIDVEYVFGVPGGAIEPLFDALARRERGDTGLKQLIGMPTKRRLNARQRSRVEGGPLAVVARHEAGAAFMADGYARESGRLGVCCGTTGPGTTNLITGVAGAYADEIPMLVITPQTALPNFGRQSLQESSVDAIDTVSMFKYCTRYNSMVSHPDQLEQKLIAAITAAFQRPRGPSHLSIPIDVFTAPIKQKHFSYNVGTLLRQPKAIDQQQLDALTEAVVNTLLLRRQKVVVLMGQDCQGASEVIHQFCEITGANLVATPMGKRWVNTQKSYYRGVFGFAGHESAAETLLDPDVGLVLAIGTELGELSTNGWDESALLNEKLIHIDASVGHFIQSPMASLHVVGHYGAIFRELITTLSQLPEISELKHQAKELVRQASDAQPSGITMNDLDRVLQEAELIKPQRLMLELVDRMDDSCRFVIDAGNAWCWATHYLHPKADGRYHIAMGYGSMAWAVASCIGVSLADTKNPVVAITGDGSYLMSAQEITVAQQYSLPIVMIVLNDQALGMVKHGQRMGGGEPIGFELPAVNYADMARAMGIASYRIESLEQLISLPYHTLTDNGPVLLDVLIDGEEQPPMGSRVKVLREKV